MKHYLLFLFTTTPLMHSSTQCQQPPIQHPVGKALLAGIINQETLCDPCLITGACLCGIIACNGTPAIHTCLIASCTASIVSYCCAPPEYFRSNFLYARIMRKIQQKIDKLLFEVPKSNTNLHEHIIKNGDNIIVPIAGGSGRKSNKLKIS